MSMLMSAKLDDMTCRHDDTYYHRQVKSTPRAYCMRIASCDDLVGACRRLRLKTGQSSYKLSRSHGQLIWFVTGSTGSVLHTQQAILLPASQVDAPKAGHCA